ncbi:MAG: tRNA preQ1(34) S-adenosylmethionine ribosyltransferase-isomerase QueA [bacterium]|nr:tRNA preQ1(34) S-adenosylmethionine ribosyltransferase-isomerase QueA [bacterium]
METSLFDYHLPPHLIAQEPPSKRGMSRLMVVDRADGSIQHRKFSDILEYIAPGDGVVVNNTKVFKARLWGNRATGARVEVFLVRALPDSDETIWDALVSPSRKVKVGESILFGEAGSVRLLEEFGDGKWRVGFTSRSACRKVITKAGHIPLPHYIAREDNASDLRRYQTVFADSSKEGAVAAPTAGFHFSQAILDKLAERSIPLIQLTLHVGPGTFKPVKAEQIEDHTVDPEFAELSAESAYQLEQVWKRGKKVWVVGTTSVRTLEFAGRTESGIKPFAGKVSLYIRPGFRFSVTDHLITNFHLPKSSLLILVSAFAGRELILRAYREAIENGYRFYSYGDAMLIL